MQVMFETRKLGDGLYVVWLDGATFTASPKRAMWSSALSRKVHICWRCEVKFEAGQNLYRPIGNQDYRMKRICPLCMARALQHEGSLREA